MGGFQPVVVGFLLRDLQVKTPSLAGSHSHRNEPLGTARIHRHLFDWPDRFVDAVKQSWRLLGTEHGKQVSHFLLNFLRTADGVRDLGAHQVAIPLA